MKYRISHLLFAISLTALAAAPSEANDLSDARYHSGHFTDVTNLTELRTVSADFDKKLVSLGIAAKK